MSQGDIGLQAELNFSAADLKAERQSKAPRQATLITKASATWGSIRTRGQVTGERLCTVGESGDGERGPRTEEVGVAIKLGKAERCSLLKFSDGSHSCKSLKRESFSLVILISDF